MRIFSQTLGLSIAMLCGGCDRVDPSMDDASTVLVELSNGNMPPDFAGSRGTAIEKLIAAQKAQREPIIFNVMKGDAPAPIGDGSGDFHAFASLHRNDAPFLGIRLRYENGGWHIAGYWTP